MDDLTKEAVKDTGVSGERASLQELLRPGPARLAVPPTHPADDRLAQKKFSRTPRWLPPTSRHFRPGTLWRGDRGSKDHIRGQACRPASRHLHQRQWQHRTRLGLIAASKLSGLPLFYGTYPITPASDILHELARHKNFGVRTFQAEDEIAGVGSAIGAAFAGSLAVTGYPAPASR